MRNFIIALAVLCSVAATPARAALNVLACEPEWASLVKEIGGDRVNVSSATTALQDPHRVEARPSLIARARNADLLVCTGAELEIGWLPLLLSQSGNPNIQAGKPGYFEAAKQVRLIEVPTRLDRSMGDVHPLGNPHLHLDPANIARVASALAERMSQVDPKESGHYAHRVKSFQDRWQEATARWQKEAAPLKGFGVVTYHKDFNYLLNWLGMRELGNLEPKPGLPPTSAHLADLLAQLAKDPAKGVLRTAYQDPRPGEWMSEHAKVPVLTLPYTVGGDDKAKDLFSLYDDTLQRLLALTK